MIREINQLEFNEIRENSILIDVRSPLEYLDGSIPGAVNIPILDDEERILVGTTYKQVSRNEARRLGVNFVSPKLPHFFDTIMDLKKQSQNLVVFCARGGYRSTAFASIFNAIGVNLFKLKDGYKGYRKYVQDNMPKLNENLTYIVMHGNTGVGKTNILLELRKQGLDVLDLEGCANHRGSLLGSVCLGDCNSQKTFEGDIFKEMTLFKSKYVFVEAESQQIGKCVIPKYIFESMKSGIHINVDASVEYRVKSLKQDYVLTESWVQESIEAIEKLRKYLSNHTVDDLQDKLRNNNFDDVARFLIENYYDAMYMHKSNQYNFKGEFTVTKSSLDTANEIIEWFKNIENIEA